jgi:hypothetical protein
MTIKLLKIIFVVFADYLHGIDESSEHMLDETVCILCHTHTHESCSSEFCIIIRNVLQFCRINCEYMSTFWLQVVNAYACICQDDDRHRDGLREVQSMPAEEQGTKGILRRTGTRVSLTCRHVSKVQKNFLRL